MTGNLLQRRHRPEHGDDRRHGHRVAAERQRPVQPGRRRHTATVAGGTGNLNVTAGGAVTAGGTVLFGQNGGGTATLLIDAGTFTATGQTQLANGTVNVTVQNGGTYTANNTVFVGVNPANFGGTTFPASNGTVTVTGGTSTFTATGTNRDPARRGGHDPRRDRHPERDQRRDGHHRQPARPVRRRGGQRHQRDHQRRRLGRRRHRVQRRHRDHRGHRRPEHHRRRPPVVQRRHQRRRRHYQERGRHQTLAAANTYQGGTTINGGAILVTNVSGSGTGTGLVRVNSGTVLAGTGFITGPVQVNGNGTVVPGTTATGVLTLTGATTLVSGATRTSASTAPPRPRADRQPRPDRPRGDRDHHSGRVQPPDRPDHRRHLRPSAGDTIILIQGTGGPTQHVFGTFGNAPAGPAFLVGTFGGQLYAATVVYNANSVVLTGFTPVPVPAHVLLACAAAALVWRHRRCHAGGRFSASRYRPASPGRPPRTSPPAAR